MKNKNASSVATLLLVLFFPNSGFASLISADLIAGSGDDYLTIDTVQNLQFLDLTLSLGYSPNEIVNGQGNFIDMGFRYANRVEVANLYAASGPYNIASGYYAENFEPATRLLNLLGILCCISPGFESSTGIYFGSDLYEFGSVSANLSNNTGQMQPYLGFVSPDNSNFGHFLVRPQAVPLPGGLLLFLTGGVFLLGFSSLTGRLKTISKFTH